ncbi:MAG: HAD family hydrolase, partial [Rubrivivax sp.]
MRRALILDFGGVISRTLFETHDETERALGLAPGTLTWRGPFDPPTDPLWQAMQRGELSERDYWLQRSREVGTLLGETWGAMETLVQRARGADPDRIVRPETAALVRQAQASGIRLAILSNELDLFYGRGLRERLPLLEAFERIDDATYTGVLKPNPKAYLGCLQALGLQAGEAV